MIFNQIQEEHQKLFDANGEYSLSICSITSSMLLNTGKMEKLDDLRPFEAEPFIEAILSK